MMTREEARIGLSNLSGAERQYVIATLRMATATASAVDAARQIDRERLNEVDKYIVAALDTKYRTMEEAPQAYGEVLELFHDA